MQDISTILYLQLKILYCILKDNMGFPGSSDCKASAYNAGDLGSFPGLERSAGGGTPVFLPGEFPRTEEEAWRATVYAIAKSGTRLSIFHTVKRTR